MNQGTDKTCFEENELGCCYCDARFVANSDDQYIDDVADESTTTCPECKKEYRLVCVDVVMYFEAYPIKSTHDATLESAD